MSVFVNARFLCQPMSGVQRHAVEVVSALDRRLTRDPALAAALGPVEALAPAPPHKPPDWSAIPLRVVSGGAGHLWEQTTLWRASRRGVLLSLCGSGPLLHRRQVLAVHDANVFEAPESFPPTYRLWHRAMRPRLAARAAAMLTVSQFSAGELARHLRVSEMAFTVIPNGADHVLRLRHDPGALRRLGLRPQGYLLTVGNRSPNKNLSRLAEAYRRAGPDLPPLVVAGGTVPGVARDACGAGGVRLLGRVSDGELRALLAGAAAFVWPSLREGFGLPPLEAMALGVPVLAARSTAMPEVLGDAALWFDPCDISDIARALRSFVGLEPEVRAALSRAGRRRAAGFTWDESAGRLAEVLEAAVRAPAADILPAPLLSSR